MPDGVLISLGLLVLVVGGDLLVRGAAALAVIAGVRPMVVGATVIAFGTSAPELAASVLAAVQDTAGLATGTVFGSNIANIGLILGVAALLHPIGHTSGSARFEVRALLGVTLLTPLPLVFGGRVTRVEGALLLAFAAWFTWRLVRRELRDRHSADVESVDPPPRGRIPLLIVLVVVGLVGLPLGASWLVQGARGVAETAGLSPEVIGVAIVAVGTSLPELAASAAAAWRGHSEMALGNVLGSNLFNLCVVLGTTAVITPLPLTPDRDGVHVAVALVATVVLASALRGVGTLSRAIGALLLVGYVGYVAGVLTLA